MSSSIVGERSFAFALKIIAVTRLLRKQKEFELASQVLRAGTSIGANVEEALAGFSRRDFIAKMGIAMKEARETKYWLRLIQDSRILPVERISPALNESDELLRMLTAIVKTSRENSSPGLKTHTSQLSTKRAHHGEA